MLYPSLHLFRYFFIGQCPHTVRYIEELSTNITLPSSAIYNKIELSICGYTGTPIVTAICNRGIGGGGIWNISSNPCEEEDFTETTRKLRAVSLVRTVIAPTRITPYQFIIGVSIHMQCRLC